MVSIVAVPWVTALFAGALTHNQESIDLPAVEVHYAPSLDDPIVFTDDGSQYVRADLYESLDADEKYFVKNLGRVHVDVANGTARRLADENSLFKVRHTSDDGQSTSFDAKLTGSIIKPCTHAILTTEHPKCLGRAARCPGCRGGQIQFEGAYTRGVFNPPLCVGTRSSCGGICKAGEGCGGFDGVEGCSSRYLHTNRNFHQCHLDTRPGLWRFCTWSSQRRCTP